MSSHASGDRSHELTFTSAANNRITLEVVRKFDLRLKAGPWKSGWAAMSLACTVELPVFLTEDFSVESTGQWLTRDKEGKETLTVQIGLIAEIVMRSAHEEHPTDNVCSRYSLRAGDRQVFS